MIEVKNSCIHVSGTKVQLMAELTGIISSLVANGFSWDDIDDVLEVAKMPPEELHEKVENAIEHMKKDAFEDLFNKFLESLQ